MNTKPRRQPASGANSTTHTATSNDAYTFTPNVAQHPTASDAVSFHYPATGDPAQPIK
jgi:hypothetical protein